MRKIAEKKRKKKTCFITFIYLFPVVAGTIPLGLDTRFFLCPTCPSYDS